MTKSLVLYPNSIGDPSKAIAVRELLLLAVTNYESTASPVVSYQYPRVVIRCIDLDCLMRRFRFLFGVSNIRWLCPATVSELISCANHHLQHPPRDRSAPVTILIARRVGSFCPIQLHLASNGLHLLSRFKFKRLVSH